jgi:GntR family transcriptional regulator of vanillate catabolism
VTRLKTKTRSESVTEQIRDLILREELKPGGHLQELPLAEALGVSRTPVRIALSNLANEGILDYRPKRGFVVREFKVSDIIDAWQMRAWLEGLAALKATEHGLTKEGQARMIELVAEGDRILSVGKLRPEDVDAYRDMNVQLHDIIIRAARSPILEGAIRRTLAIPMVSHRMIPWDDFEHIKRTHGDHHRLLEAMLAGEAWRAEAIMREHVYSGTRLLENMRLGIA